MNYPLRIVSVVVLLNAIFFLPSVFSNNGNCYGQVIDTEVFEKKLKEFTGDRSLEKPGAVMIVNQNQQQVIYYATGTANMENKISIDSNTVFEAASVSKQFTAAAVLLLADAGKINLNDNVRKYIPELPDYGLTLTIKNLLLHTSGLKDWRNITYVYPVYTANRLYNQQTALDIICAQKSLNFNPGDQYRYSNSGYDLLSVIVERVSGSSFASFAKDNLLVPAGMMNSTFRGKYTDIIKNRATGYLPSGNSYLQGIVLDETCGAAGLYTTVADLQKWNKFLMSDKVSENFKNLRTTQGVLNNGKVIPYSLGGVEVHEYRGQTEIRHGGLIAGYRAWLVYYPESGVSASYLSNDRGLLTTELSGIIREVCFGEDTDTLSFINLTLSEKELGAIAGKYRNINDNWGYLDIKIKEGKLVSGTNTIKFTGKNKISINNQVYEVRKNELVQKTSSGDFIFKKVQDVPEKIQYEYLQGNYKSNDVTIGYTFSYEEEALYAITPGLNKIKLSPIYKNGNTISFRGLSNGLAIIYHFTVNNAKEVSLVLSLPRADKIPFEKIN